MMDPIPHLRGRKDWAFMPHEKFVLLLAWEPSPARNDTYRLSFHDFTAITDFGREMNELHIERKPWGMRHINHLLRTHGKYLK